MDHLVGSDKWFDGPSMTAVQSPDGVQFIYPAKESQEAVLRTYPGPKLLTFPPSKKTELDQVLDEVREHADEIEDIVVLYRSKKGDYVSVSNQGDTAGNILFMEKAKMRFLQDDKPPTPSSAG